MKEHTSHIASKNANEAVYLLNRISLDLDDEVQLCSEPKWLIDQTWNGTYIIELRYPTAAW